MDTLDFQRRLGEKLDGYKCLGAFRTSLELLPGDMFLHPNNIFHHIDNILPGSRMMIHESPNAGGCREVHITYAQAAIIFRKKNVIKAHSELFGSTCIGVFGSDVMIQIVTHDILFKENSGFLRVCRISPNRQDYLVFREGDKDAFQVSASWLSGATIFRPAPEKKKAPKVVVDFFEIRGAKNSGWGLVDDEIDEGFVLACQAHPTTSKIVIDFDDV